VALVANRAHPGWFSTLLLSSMFVGWVLHRWVTGKAPAWHAVLAVSAAAVDVIVVHNLHFEINYIPNTSIHTSARAEILTFLAAYGVFLGALALRRVAFPAALRWLGEVSYSVYLVHGVVLAAVPSVGNRLTTVAVWIAVTLLVSWGTHPVAGRRPQVSGSSGRSTHPALPHETSRATSR